VHTADEAWLALGGATLDDESCVHDQLLPAPLEQGEDPAWAEVMARRDQALKALEERRAAGGLDNPLDAGIELQLPQDVHARLLPFEPELADLCGVSRFALARASDESVAVVDLTREPRCERSWKRDATVRQRSDGGWLSDRDAAALGLD
jgi:isoleucyl-tRNA synthetase